MTSPGWPAKNWIISDDPTPRAKVFRKVTNPVRLPVISPSLREAGRRIGKGHTQSKVAPVRQWMHAYKLMKGHLRLYRGGGDGGTLPEWLKGKGYGWDGHWVYNNTV